MTRDTCRRLGLVLVAVSALGFGACASTGGARRAGDAGPEPAGPPARSTVDLAAAGQRLLEAAQRQDEAAVRELLAAGVDVDFKSRYGATALFFAVDKGNLEIVRLLLESGADVDVEDTFYRSTPLSWALYSLEDSAVHRDIVLLLLGQGASGAAEVLAAGARLGDLELVRAAADAGALEPRALLSASKRAREAGHDDVADFLAPLLPENLEPAPSVPREVLAGYVGDYKSREIDLAATVFLDGDTLKLQARGQEALGLAATGGRDFTAEDEDGIDLTFRVRGDVVEGFELRQGGREFFFTRFDPEAIESRARSALPPLEEARRGEPIDWPRFRGRGAAGIGDGQGVPFAWDGEGGANVAWKTAIPGLGLSSPVISHGRVFVSTAVSSGDDAGLRIGLYGDVDSVEDDFRHAWQVYALSKATGEILWVRTVDERVPPVKRHLKSSHANPTPVTDGRRLVVHFPSVGLFCFDLDGNELWSTDLGVLSSGWFYDPTYEWGFASSPIVHDAKVIVQVDIQQGSYIAAFDLATGEPSWLTERDEIPTWGTPAVLPGATRGAAAPDEIVTNGTTIRGYDADTGNELWSLGPNSEITVASPVVSDGLAYVTGGYSPVRPIFALAPGGRGDLRPSDGTPVSEAIVWSHPRGGAYMPTPIAYRGILYVLHNNGRLVTYDASTGDEIYRERLGSAESFTSSPVAADGRLFFTSEDGTTFVVRAGAAYELLETNELGEIVMATPAISDGVMVVRGVEHVWALGRQTDEPR